MKNRPKAVRETVLLTCFDIVNQALLPPSAEGILCQLIKTGEIISKRYLIYIRYSSGGKISIWIRLEMEYDHENKGEQCSCWINRIKKTITSITKTKTKLGPVTLFCLIDFVVTVVRNVTCLNPLTRWGRRGERLGDVTGRQYNARNSDVFLPRAPHGLGDGDVWHFRLWSQLLFGHLIEGREVKFWESWVILFPRVLNFNR